MEPSTAVAHPLNPTNLCFDAEGTATIPPRALRVGELLLVGKPMSHINAEIAEGFIIVVMLKRSK